MINNPLKNKYYSLYMDMALRASKESLDPKHQVGCVIITKDGLIAPGWNGTPPGFSNQLRDKHLKTKPYVIHAERNALDKLTREGVSAKDAILFCTHAPCLECAKSIANVGIAEVVYMQPFKSYQGLDHLHACNILIQHLS